MTTSYFKHETISEHTLRIIDCCNVACYLVIGEDKACLIDTGNGIGDIKAYVETLTDKPIFVILTHGHHDHCGGSAYFDEVYLNPVELPLFNYHNELEFRLEEHKHHGDEGKYTVEEYIPKRTAGFKDIHDGDSFDLGGCHIDLYLCVGHTRGILVPIIREDRVAVFGDAIGVGVLLFDEYSATVNEYLASLKGMKKHETEYDSIVRCHGTFESKKELLDNVIECCEKILNHTDAHYPVNFMGHELFSANVVEHQKRVDGKEGNILYSLEKVK